MVGMSGPVLTSVVLPKAGSVTVPGLAHPITYDPALPISLWREEIARTIAEHQVVVIAGETGSGKTTQIPKICLELGRTLDRSHPAETDRGPQRGRAGRRGAEEPAG